MNVAQVSWVTFGGVQRPLWQGRLKSGLLKQSGAKLLLFCAARGGRKRAVWGKVRLFLRGVAGCRERELTLVSRAFKGPRIISGDDGSSFYTFSLG